jgi:hypothetical protein
MEKPFYIVPNANKNGPTFSEYHPNPSRYISIGTGISLWSAEASRLISWPHIFLWCRSEEITGLLVLSSGMKEMKKQ